MTPACRQLRKALLLLGLTGLALRYAATKCGQKLSSRHAAVLAYARNHKQGWRGAEMKPEKAEIKCSGQCLDGKTNMPARRDAHTNDSRPVICILAVEAWRRRDDASARRQ